MMTLQCSYYLQVLIACSPYSQVPNKWECPNKQGVEKIPKFDKRGVGIWVTALNDYTRAERIKQVVIKHKTKIYTKACYFALEFGRK